MSSQSSQDDEMTKQYKNMIIKAAIRRGHPVLLDTTVRQAAVIETDWTHGGVMGEKCVTRTNVFP